MVALGARTAALILTWFAVADASRHNRQKSTLSYKSYKPSCGDVIEKDFAIVGGGSSGTYSAVRLKDLGHSIVLIEAKNLLGGHSETYVDPVTGGTIDIGVIVYQNTTTVNDYFGKFGIPLAPPSLGTGETLLFDFETGQPVTSFEGPPPAEIGQALQIYVGEMLKYPYILAGWGLPDPVPEDLLLPFKDFVVKYNIQAAVPTIWSFGQGIGDLLEIPTVYAMKLIDVNVVQALSTGFVAPASGGVHQLYEKALASLGSDVLLSSTVIKATRPSSDETLPVSLVVDRETCLQTITAKKLIITTPPLVDTLRPFGLDDQETSIFSQFQPGAYYTGVIRDSGLSETSSTNNINLTSPYGLSPLPGIYAFNPSGIPGLLNVKYGSKEPISDAAVLDDIFQSIENIATANNLTSNPKLEIYSSHAPFELKVGAEAIRDGFYANLLALQGRRNTFYTGAAWHAHDSSRLWAFTEGMLDGWVKSLG